MTNERHLSVLQKGVEAWNRWRYANYDAVDLTNADLTEASLAKAKLDWTDLSGAKLERANLRGANLVRANLMEVVAIQADFAGADFRGAYFSNPDLAHYTRANLSQADFTEANLSKVDLTGVNFGGACLARADLSGAYLAQTDFRGADLTGANLSGANLIETDMRDAILAECMVYGTSAWNILLDGAVQAFLRITPLEEPAITVDNLEVAQFLYLMLNNEKLRTVIDTITSKAVLILGRFTPERKAALDALRNELRRLNYLSVIFDFDKPVSRDLTETLSTLAHLARFVIADLTDAKSIPQELSMIVPTLYSVPVQPLIQEDDREYGMFEHWQRAPSVLPIYRYWDQDSLLANLKERVITPAELKAKELQPLAPGN